MHSGNMKLLRILPPIALGLIALLWVTDVINQSTFITLVVLETVASMGLTLYFTKKQREQANAPQDLQSHINETNRSTSKPE